MNHRDEWHLETKHIGRHVLHFDQLDSTNTYAATMAADPANDGVVILANEQTAGRGQPGRTWNSPAGSGVWISVLLFPPRELRRAPILTAWAAVSVCLTIREMIGLHATIKWPNDVLIHGQKVCGILIEQGADHVVAGIGLNVNQPASYFAQMGLPRAASLSMFTNDPLDRVDIARRLIDQLDHAYGSLREIGPGQLEQQWRLHLGLLGKLVQVECLDRSVRGTLHDVGLTGIELESPDGTTMRFAPETIRHIHAIVP